MRVKRIIQLIVMLFCLPLTAAGEFTVKKVIPVGPVAGGMIWPARWSPTGTRIAFFSSNDLLLADTTGTTVHFASLPHAPNNFVWLDDSELVVRTCDRDSLDNGFFGLYIIRIPTGVSSTIIETVWPSNQRDPTPAIRFWGPYRSSDGAVFYEWAGSTDRARVSSPILPSQGRERLESAAAMRKQMAIATAEGVLSISLDARDTVRLTTKKWEPFPDQVIEVDHAKTFMYLRESLVRLSDEFAINPGTLAGPLPEHGVFWGFSWGSFSPTRPELFGVVTCNDRDQTISTQMVMVDCDSLKLTRLEPIVGMKDCWAPVCSSDGEWLAFVSHGTLFLVKRGQA
jgi:hypothetical protein